MHRLNCCCCNVHMLLTGCFSTRPNQWCRSGGSCCIRAILASLREFPGTKATIQSAWQVGFVLSHNPTASYTRSIALHGVMWLSKFSICMFSIACRALCLRMPLGALLRFRRQAETSLHFDRRSAFRSAVLQKATKACKSFLQRTCFLSQQACLN